MVQCVERRYVVGRRFCPPKIFGVAPPMVSVLCVYVCMCYVETPKQVELFLVWGLPQRTVTLY